ncbi:MAG: hypothetical protein HYY37_00820 [Candidatus Aenigmarchaeota archaeon]|nr:hypothetical protein [Candidatus Aenigmarchaeota archaeon]
MNDQHKADLTCREDLAIAVMNLISTEEHLSFTIMKTGKKEYMPVLDAVRKLRINLLKMLIINNEGELWCISKHLLAATMRQMEVATKYITTDARKAQDMLDSALSTYGLFWLMQQEDKKNDLKKPQKKKRMEK